AAASRAAGGGRGACTSVSRRGERASERAGLPSPLELSPEALRALAAYAWPGNVRELRWMMERLLVTAGQGPVLVEHLPEQLRTGRAKPPPPPPGRNDDVATREAVIAALSECDGNQTRAAERLGVSRRTLINRMIEFDLPRPRKR
ncbi:MAG TPA: helix-turn-helix domain-containing protein, partial [Labilithrix sp.]|nr:helix-turn-helix domain-containing protein [Labilithrix sp.]